MHKALEKLGSNSEVPVGTRKEMRSCSSKALHL